MRDFLNLIGKHYVGAKKIYEKLCEIKSWRDVYSVREKKVSK